MSAFFKLLNPIVSEVMSNSISDDVYEQYDQLLMMLYADDGCPNMGEY